jgi:porin
MSEFARYLCLAAVFACMQPAFTMVTPGRGSSIAMAEDEHHVPGRPHPPPPTAPISSRPRRGAGEWARWEHASGTWGQARPWLEDRGVTFGILYTGEALDKLHGGIGGNTDVEYRGNLDVTLTLDSGRLGLWPGATAFVYFENGQGSGVTKEHVGAVQLLSNIEAQDFTQISAYWIEQRLGGDMFHIKLGKQDANVEFCRLDYGIHFINSSFALIPTVPIPTFPNPALGASVLVKPTEWLSLGGGIYDGDAKGGTFGFESTFDGKGGQFAVVEFDLSTSVLLRHWPTGTYRVGFWDHTKDVEEITNDPNPDKFSENHGVYLTFDQLVLAESANAEGPQGLGAFAQFGWAPQDRNRLTRYLGAGLAYTGAIPRRDSDVLGAAVAHVRFSDRVEDLEGRTEETIVEVFYEALLTRWLTLQPDIQFVLNPGGNGRDALVAGSRFYVDF